MRRTIFLSRGALEVMKNPIFGVNPQIVVSNDWHAALVPVFLKLDLRYSCHPAFKHTRTCHIIHNCGRDYHGIIPAVYDRQELWPMLEMGYEHYSGLSDPHHWPLLNMTAGAILHLSGALIAVSKPYAQQMLSPWGGDGLERVLHQRRDAIFGISNGVDQPNLRKVVVLEAQKALRKARQIPEHIHDWADTESFTRNLLVYKGALKKALQAELGLQDNPEGLILSFVGRLAEQKGIQLFNGHGWGDGVTVMESILLRYPNTQFVIAGSMTPNDRTADNFRNLVEHLRWKYPGRVAGIFNFIPHETAIRIMAASDFYMMPSRFEPGGITQLEAITCGAIVIARRIGGISVTLTDYHASPETGNSFLFDDYSSTVLRDTICRAVHTLQDPELHRELILRAAQAEHDWSNRSEQYLALFQYILGVVRLDQPAPYLERRAEELVHLRA